MIYLSISPADAGTRPSSATELQYLTAWNTRMIVPRTSSNSIEMFRSRTGLSNISNLIGPLISILQLATYLKYSIDHDYRLLSSSTGRLEALYLLPTIRNYYIGLELDENTLDTITGIFDIVYFTEVGLPATAIDDVGVSILDDDRVRIYIGTEVTARYDDSRGLGQSTVQHNSTGISPTLNLKTVPSVSVVRR